MCADRKKEQKLKLALTGAHSREAQPADADVPGPDRRLQPGRAQSADNRANRAHTYAVAGAGDPSPGLIFGGVGLITSGKGVTA